MDNHRIHQISTNQVQLDVTALKVLLRKHQQHSYRRPISQRAIDHFSIIQRQVAQLKRPIILDSGCGRGQSSRQLAKQFPNHWIIAVDQSAHRLQSLQTQLPDNMIVIQENCIDLWRLIAHSSLQIDLHMILYPNPWPKKQHEKRRWYAHPIAPTLFGLSRLTMIRSNWAFYLQSCAVVASQLALHAELSQLSEQNYPLTHFESKYFQSNTPVYQLSISCAY